MVQGTILKEDRMDSSEDQKVLAGTGIKPPKGVNSRLKAAQPGFRTGTIWLENNTITAVDFRAGNQAGIERVLR